jgi:hypothetical protein
MVHQAAESIRPVSRDPVHHVAAVGTAECAGPVTGQPRIALERGGEALLQILERLATPIAADRVRERLAVTGRAVKIDERGRVARARINLRIPAITPGVCETRLRATVHDEGNRVGLARLPVPGLDDISEHRFAARAGEAELLRLTEPHVGEARGVDIGHLSRRRAAGDQLQVGGRRQTLQCKHDAVAGDVEFDHVARPGEHAA